jgi:hypothetical protein
MARTDAFRFTDAGPIVPGMGTFPSSANTLYPEGTIVTRSSAGRAVSPGTADLTGNPALGVSKHTILNRTGDEAGGLDDSTFVEVAYGIFFFDLSGDTPQTGELLYVVDNQTLSKDPSTGRGLAGTCTEVRTLNGATQVGCFFGPAAATEAAARAGALNIPIPLTSLRLSTGAAIPAFGAGTADGFELTSSEALSLRINDDSTTIFTGTVPLTDHDDTQPLVLHILGFRVGAADVTAAITVGAFAHEVGALHTADANFGSASTAFAAATNVVSEATVTLAAADVPAGPCSVTFTFVASAALDDDDLCILAMWLTGAKK